jgi:hypothetical protein
MVVLDVNAKWFAAFEELDYPVLLVRYGSLPDR